MTSGDPILVARDVIRRFGGLVAVDVRHLEVTRGSITALIGPNGAGKTTFFNVLSGFDSAERGSWSFDGVPLQHKPAHRIARAGMVRTFQLTKALARMTVLDNVRLAARGQGGESMLAAAFRPLWHDREVEVTRRAEELLGVFGLARMRDEYAGTLSGGQRKLLELARALMAEPRMVLLDEPTAGINPALTESLLDHIRSVRDSGVTVLFVEHDMDVVMDISDRIVCMAEGAVIAEGTPQEIVSNRVVIDAYLGADRGAL